MILGFTPLVRQPMSRENIILNGRVIGTVENEIVNGQNRFMASLDFPKVRLACSGAAIGFGATRGEAISDALRIGIEAAANMLDQLMIIKGEVETND